jgi:choline-sulfatase
MTEAPSRSPDLKGYGYGMSHRSESANVLLIVSDQHHPRKAGYLGHPLLKTPNLDRIAGRGTHFTRAYCNTPVCGPSRISFMTGQYLHHSGLWSNGVPWDGKARTFAHVLEENGIRNASRGKMDVPGEHMSVGFSDFDEPIPRPAWKEWPLKSPARTKVPGFDNGFSYAFMSRPATTREDNLAEEGLDPDQLYIGKDGGNAAIVGHGDHDQHVANQSIDWLRKHGQDGPWMLHVGFLNPHWPVICPRKFRDLYDAADIDMPVDFNLRNQNLHPVLQAYQRAWGHFPEVRDEEHLREIIATYYGMISTMDDQVGQLLDELDRLGIADDTYVIYTSDHGDGCGEHGLFSKLSPYEGSSGVPLLMSGPGVPQGEREDTAVSLIDVFPTILDMMDLRFTGDLQVTRPGTSLLPLVRGENHVRLDHVFCEYHGQFFPESWYMIVKDRYKYIHFMNAHPQLFDIIDDPGECSDLAGDPEYCDIVSRFEALLRSTADIEGIAAQVKSDYCLNGAAEPSVAQRRGKPRV